jgi:hypothetical protein
MQKNLYHTFYLVVLLLAMVGCKKSSDPQAPQTNEAVTIDNYNRITTGMTTNQVVTILGKATTTSSTTHSWSFDDTNSIVIYVVFSNDVVQSKNQVGLASPTTSGGGGSPTTGTGGGGTTTGGCPATHNGHTVYTGPRGGCYYINSKGNKTYI